MYTTFAVSALFAATALARGRGDGSSRWNSVSAPLIYDNNSEFALTLEYYYDDDQFHGDLILEFPNNGLDKTLYFGFCFAGKTEPILYDCLEAEYVIDIDAIALAQTDELQQQVLGDYQVLDMYTQNANWNIYDVSGYPTYDDNKDATDNAEVNWRLSANKSNAVGCGAIEGSVRNYCDKLQVHFFRDWITEQEIQDIQISSDSGEYDIKGFVTNQPTKTKKFGGFNKMSSSALKINPAATKVAHLARTEEEKAADKVAKNDRTGEVLTNQPEEETEDSVEPTEPKTDEDETVVPADTDGTDDTEDTDDTDDTEDTDDTTEGGNIKDAETKETKKEEEEEDTAAAVVATAAAMATAFGALFI